MPILLVTSVFPPVLGGSATVYESLGARGQGRVLVLAPSLNYLTGAPLQGAAGYDAQCGFTVIRLKLLRTKMYHGSRLISRARLALHDLFVRARLLFTIARLRRSHGITALCIGDLVSLGWLAHAAPALLRLPVILYVHGEEITTADNFDSDGRRRRRALSAATRIITVSRFTRLAMIADMAVDPAKIALIPNGVDTTRFRPAPRNQDLAARLGLIGHTVLLSVGRLTARKGMDRVIECLPDLLRENPALIYLIVGDGAQRCELRQRAETLGVTHAVRFAGAVPGADLPAYYGLGDIFVLPNRTLPNGDTEGFGIVFLEANASGIPVIAGNSGGSGDAVADGDNGLLVNGNDTASITAAIRRLLNDAGLRAHLRAGGLRAAGRHDWRGHSARFLEACKK